MTDRERHARAAEIIRIAMGWRWQGRGRGARRIWLADEDPLALWCGVEAIVSLIDPPPGGSRPQQESER